MAEENSKAPEITSEAGSAPKKGGPETSPSTSGSKKFSAPEIVIMMIIAVLNDLLTILADLSLAIPVLGEIIVLIAEITDFMVWGIILFWFAFKVGLWGMPGFVQMIGGITEFIGIPGRTITTAVGIFATNNPSLAKVAKEAAVDALVE